MRGNISPNVTLAIIAGAELLLLLMVLSAVLPRFVTLYQNLGAQEVWWYPLALFLRHFSTLVWLAALAVVVALLAWASHNDSEGMQRGLQILCLVLALCIPVAILALFKPLVQVIQNMVEPR